MSIVLIRNYKRVSKRKRIQKVLTLVQNGHQNLESKLLQASESFSKVLSLVPNNDTIKRFKKLSDSALKITRILQLLGEAKKFLHEDQFHKAVKQFQLINAKKPFEQYLDQSFVTDILDLAKQFQLTLKKKSEDLTITAVNFLSQDSFEQALDHFEQALELFPDNDRAQKGKKESLENLRNLTQIIRVLRSLPSREQIALSEIAARSHLSKEQAERFLQLALTKQPTLGEYFSFEQMFIKGDEVTEQIHQLLQRFEEYETKGLWKNV